MFPNKQRKIVWILFVLMTIVSSSILLYSFHVYYGVYRAIRLINITVRNFSFTLSSESAWTETEITVENPSEYSFNVEYLQQKLYLNSLDEDEYIFTGYYLFNQTVLRPFSTFNITLKIVIPDYKMPMVIKTTDRNWLAIFNIRIKNFIIDALTLSFLKELS